jgi:hypothetical protein
LGPRARAAVGRGGVRAAVAWGRDGVGRRARARRRARGRRGEARGGADAGGSGAAACPAASERRGVVTERVSGEKGEKGRTRESRLFAFLAECP